MEICKNKNSGKYFIYIADSGNNEAFFVTPLNQIKSLKISLFNELEGEEEDVDYLLSHALITEAQVERFREYEKDRSEEAKENVLDSFDDLNSYEQRKLFEEIKKKLNKT
jgi:hypothetical protein